KELEAIQTSSDLYYKEMTIVRTAQGLRKVLDFVQKQLREDISLVLRNRLLVGEIMAMAMLAREESRGTHYREDYPDSSRLWDERIIISKGPSGEPLLQKLFSFS
ncbi:MAG: hypothetical protein ACM3YE_17255, partial [Bacteroidota bacterium]